MSFRQQGLKWALRVHHIAGQWNWFAHAYLWSWAQVIRRMPHSMLREDMVSTFALGKFPDLKLPIRSTRLGRNTTVKVRPHSGALDFAAYFDALSHEPEIFAVLEPRMADYDLVVEIGANIGVFTVFFARTLADAGRGGRVLAFEPGAEAFRWLTENVQAQETHNVTLLNCAVAGQVSLRRFYELPGADVTSTLDPHHAAWHAKVTGKKPEEKIIVTMDGRVLDALIGDTGRMLIKIDAECAEVEILRSLEPTIRRLRPDVLVEVLHAMEGQFNELAFLREGYRLMRLTPEGPVEMPQFVGDASHRNRDYLLLPRERA